MTYIRFQRNDPSAPLPVVRRKLLRRTGEGARLQFEDDDPDPGRYEPGSNDFNHWQCIQAAHLCLDAWEAAVGHPLREWRGIRRYLRVLPRKSTGLNAGYDRSEVFFQSEQVAGRRIFAGSSVDVVAHEVGHAILDATREGLYDTSFPQVDAFHEAFGDVMAIYTSLRDPSICKAVLETPPHLGPGSFLERIAAELLSARGPGARNAANALRLSESSEVRHLTQVMTGCWYDLLVGRFEAMRGDESDLATLGRAAREALHLLDRALREAQEVEDFLPEIGRRMHALAKTPALKIAVRDAFANHGIETTTPGVAGASELPGPPPRPDSRGLGMLSAAARSVLARDHFGVPKSEIRVRPIRAAGRPAVSVTVDREFGLGNVARDLSGAIVRVREHARVESDATTPVLTTGHAVDRRQMRERALDYVRDLVAEGRVRNVEASYALPGPPCPTHSVYRRHGKAVLRRYRFACFCE